jgi:hypothetical protein
MKKSKKHLWAFSFFHGMFSIALAASSEINRNVNSADNQFAARARTYGYVNGFRAGFAEAMLDRSTLQPKEGNT